jgi:hypothetical protein
MTQAQRDAIILPATGLLIYQTNNTPGFYYYTGSTWTAVKSNSSSGGWSLTGNAGTDPNTNFIGTTDAQSLVFKVNNQRAGLIDYSTCCSGTRNTAFGQIALNSVTSGADNTATGYGALYTNTTGNQNVAYGKYALFNNNANDNTGLGFNAMFFNTTGTHNTATGGIALQNNIASNNNTANGYAALYSNNGGNENTGVGVSSLYANISGNDNTATGFAALNSNTASNNTAAGAYALYTNTSGTDNTALGTKSLYYNTTGYLNTAVGSRALYSNELGQFNTAVGSDALLNNKGSANTACGNSALAYNTSGIYNSSFGESALVNNTEGIYNSALGRSALYSVKTGSYNTGLGTLADVNGENFTNATAIGYNAIADASNKVRIGNNDVTSIGGKVGWTTFSDGRYKRNVKQNVMGLSFINSLQPVTYTVDINGLNEHYDKGRRHDSLYEKRKEEMKESTTKATKIVYNGFIAQDVEKAAEKLNYNFSGVDRPESKDGLYGLRYADFVVPLVKAVQELSKMNDDKDAKITALETRLEKLEGLLKINSSAISLSDATLDQNIPNPFTNSTTINYNLPQKFTTAQIRIMDKLGKTLKTINAYGSGRGTLNIDAAILSSGAYNYSLYVDGKLVGTKQMERLK